MSSSGGRRCVAYTRAARLARRRCRSRITTTQWATDFPNPSHISQQSPPRLIDRRWAARGSPAYTRITHGCRVLGGGGHARKCVAPNAVVCPNIFTTLRRFLFREREKKTLHVHTYTYYYIVPMCIRHDVSTPLCIIWFPQAAAQRLSCRPAETTPMGKTARRILCIVHSRAYVPILYHTYPCINGKNGFYVRADRVCTV